MAALDTRAGDLEAAAGRAPRRDRALRLRRLAQHVLFVGAVIAIWQALAGRAVDSLILASPSSIAGQFGTWVSNGYLWSNLSYTLESLLTGFIVGSVAATVFSMLLSESQAIGRFIEPYILALSSVPYMALAPLFLLWFGTGLTSKIVVCALTTFFVVFVNAFAGMRDTDSHLLELGRILRASRWQRFRSIKLPASLPFLIAGLKLALPRALIAVVIAEFLASDRGLGNVLVTAGQQLNTAGVFLAAVVLAVLVFMLTGLATMAERRLLRWKPAEHR